MDSPSPALVRRSTGALGRTGAALHLPAVINQACERRGLALEQLEPFLVAC